MEHRSAKSEGLAYLEAARVEGQRSGVEGMAGVEFAGGVCSEMNVRDF
jgi:hypothetical protein